MIIAAKAEYPPRVRLVRRVNVPGTLFVVALCLAWELVVAQGVVTLVFFPPPSDVFVAAGELLSSGQMVRDIIHTLTAAASGWVFGSVIGILAGTAIGVSQRNWRGSMASIDLLRSIPAITFVSVAALLFGFSLRMEVMVTTYAALWPVLINTVEGLRRIDHTHLDTARVLQVSRIKTVLKIMLPGAAGSIIVGLRLGLGLALTLAVASEMVGNPAGVGFQLVMQQQALQPAAMFAYIIAIGALGVVLNKLLLVFIRLIRPGIVASLREDA